jgi:hypothetical protein
MKLRWKCHAAYAELHLIKQNQNASKREKMREIDLTVNLLPTSN